MAYADQKQNKAVAIGSTLAIQTAIGAALFTGLVVTTTTKPPEPPLVTEFEALPPPPPAPEPEPPKQTVQQPRPTTPPINAPDPIVKTPTESTIPTTTIITPYTPPTPPAPTPGPFVIVPTPAPPPAVDLSRLVKPRGNVGDWFPHDSYPPAARRAGAEGRVSVALSVGADGRVTGCDVTASSGNGDLDTATCRLATRNGRFAPALNAQGQAVATTVTLPPVRWRLEE